MAFEQPQSSMDYRGIYEDLLAMERRAEEEGRQHGMNGVRFDLFCDECYRFRLDLLRRFYFPTGWIYV